MTSVQLQFDLGPTHVQHQIAELEISMGKVRRKLFAEMQEVKNQYAELLKEHEAIKLQLQALSPLSRS